MDLLDFDPEPLYFDDPLPPEVEALLRAAADGYAEDEAEAHLMRAYFLAPEQLTVLVALYRYFYYRHALDEALFALQEGALSDVVESPLGFHILRCDAILAPGAMLLAEALPRVRAMLAGDRARGIQRAWLRQLLGGDRAPPCPAPESNVA